MAEASMSTENKIKDVACQLFCEKGFKGTTIREVAEGADVNIALVNYYFKSKELLFLSIFEEKFQQYTEVGFTLLTDASKSVSERIELYIQKLSELLFRDKHMAIFIFSELHYNSKLLDRLVEVRRKAIGRHEEKLQKLLDEACSCGKVRKVSALDFQLMIISLMVFPFISRPLIEKSREEIIEFPPFIESWKVQVKEMITSYLVH